MMGDESLALCALTASCKQDVAWPAQLSQDSGSLFGPVPSDLAPLTNTLQLLANMGVSGTATQQAARAAAAAVSGWAEADAYFADRDFIGGDQLADHDVTAACRAWALVGLVQPEAAARSPNVLAWMARVKGAMARGGVGTGCAMLGMRREGAQVDLRPRPLPSRPSLPSPHTRLPHLRPSKLMRGPTWPLRPIPLLRAPPRST